MNLSTVTIFANSTILWYFYLKAEMGKNTSVILGEHFEKFIQDELNTGRFASASEVIRSGLRLLEIEESKIKAINEAIVIGEESGNPIPFDNKAFKNRMKTKYKANA